MLHDNLSATAAAPCPSRLFMWKSSSRRYRNLGRARGIWMQQGLPAASPEASTLALFGSIFFNSFHTTTDKFKKPAFYLKHIWHSGRALGKQTDDLLFCSMPRVHPGWHQHAEIPSPAEKNSQDLDVAVISSIFWKAVKNYWLHRALLF